MARELGLNPKGFGKLANHRQEPWKIPLPQYIEHLYRKRFGRDRPEAVKSIEDRFKDVQKKKTEKRARKEARRRQADNVGVAWYRPEQWGRLREISAGHDEIEETYAEWLESAERAIATLAESGVQASRVDVDVEDLAAWCRDHNRTVDAAARAEYATDILRRMDQVGLIGGEDGPS